MCVHMKENLDPYTPEHTEEIFQAPHVRTWPGVSFDNLFITKLVDVGFVSGTGVGQIGGHGSWREKTANEWGPGSWIGNHPQGPAGRTGGLS